MSESAASGVVGYARALGSASLAAQLAEQLCASDAPLRQRFAEASLRRRLPRRDAVAEALGKLRAALFSWHFGPPELSETDEIGFVRRALAAALEQLGSTIGGNVWLTHSVPPGSRVSQARVREESFASGAGI